MRFLIPPARHEDKVKRVQREIKASSSELYLSPSFSNELNSKSYKKGKGVDLSSFSELIAIDEEALLIWVEPKMTFGKLVDETLKLGYIPEVVPEFQNITVGGAIMGGALESSSFQHGLFSDSCEEMELVLGNGEIVLASQKENADLFYGLFCSFGTLAFLTLVQIRIKKCSPFVKLTLERTFSPQALSLSFQKKREVDFMEGIALTPHLFIGLFGKCVEKAEEPLVELKKCTSRWFIQHIISHADKDTTILYLPIRDYLFRYDLGAFWMGKYLLSFSLILKSLLKIDVKSLPKEMAKVDESLILDKRPSPLFRFLFGWSFTSKRLYALWHGLPQNVKENLFFIHDFLLPWDKADKQLSSLMEEAECFPLWLCPVKGTLTPQFLSCHFGSFSFLNVGVYGFLKKNKLLEELEEKIVQMGGRKMLYSYTSLSEQRFWEVYNGEKYDRLRKKFYGENCFPSLYNKVANETQNLHLTRSPHQK